MPNFDDKVLAVSSVNGTAEILLETFLVVLGVVLLNEN